MNDEIKRDNTDARTTVWNVNGEEHKMKLDTFAVTQLEEQLGGNLMTMLSDDKGNLPKLKTMLMIACAGLRAYDEKMTLKKTYELFDKYIEAGGSQTEFAYGPFVNLYKVSGFFQKKKVKEMNDLQKNLEKSL